MATLTDKQKSFVDHYLICLNATEAAIKAGYSSATARQIGSENLSKPDIRAEIDSRLRKLTMSADEVMKRLSDMAGGDLTRYMFSNGELDIEALKDDGMGHLLKKYKRIKRTTTTKNGDILETKHTEFEFYPADGAIDRLMRYHSLYNDKVTVSWKDQVMQLINDGHVTKEEVEKELGNELATELFTSAGIRAD